MGVGCLAKAQAGGSKEKRLGPTAATDKSAYYVHIKTVISFFLAHKIHLARIQNFNLFFFPNILITEKIYTKGTTMQQLSLLSLLPIRNRHLLQA